jgi:hypothetical protein
MALIQFTKSFALELISGVHDFSADTFKVAVFSAVAGLSIETTAYATDGEIIDTGYTAGGAAVAPSSGYPELEGTVAAVRFDGLSWTLAATNLVRYFLLYNESKDNRAVCVFDLGDEKSVTGALAISFPLTLDPFVQVRVPVL